MTINESEASSRNLLSWLKSNVWALILVGFLIAGILLSTLIPKPAVGIIRLNDAIHSFTARELITQIAVAKEDPNVRAVVLVLDSPGGTVVDSEAVYLELADFRKEKPIITLASGMAASGAYYIAVGTDYILAGPSSPIGNVGVISQLPETPAVFEDLASTGPYKFAGSARETRLRDMEAIKQAFFQAVSLGRGDRLNLSESELLTGEIWSGSIAEQLGLIDEVGSEHVAIQRAAELAQITNYEVIELREYSGLPPQELFPFFIESNEGTLSPYPRQSGVFLLYIPPSQ